MLKISGIGKLLGIPGDRFWMKVTKGRFTLELLRILNLAIQELGISLLKVKLVLVKKKPKISVVKPPAGVKK